jgi:hypothetical protein
MVKAKGQIKRKEGKEAAICCKTVMKDVGGWQLVVGEGERRLMAVMSVNSTSRYL